MGFGKCTMDLGCGQTFVPPLKNTTNWATRKLVHSTKRKGLKVVGLGSRKEDGSWRLVDLGVFVFFFPHCSSFSAAQV